MGEEGTGKEEQGSETCVPGRGKGGRWNEGLELEGKVDSGQSLSSMHRVLHHIPGTT